MATTTKKSPYVIGSRPIHVHKLGDRELECNSPYCDYMDAHPTHQENQRSPWKDQVE